MVDIGNMMLHDWIISITPWAWLRSFEYSFAHLSFLQTIILVGFAILIFGVVVLWSIPDSNEKDTKKLLGTKP